jgi:arylsulfatase A-like enzyme
MDDTPRQSLGVGPIAGAVAGVIVGAVDGARAALVFGAGPQVALGTALLGAGVDGFVGLVAGTAIELVVRAGLWGRRARAPMWSRVGALVVAGLAAGGAAVAMVAATAMRNNRFLAAGLTALAALAAGLVGSWLAPALARLATARSATADRAASLGPAGALLAPLAAIAVAAGVFVPLAGSRAPLVGDVLARHVWSAAIAAALLPGAVVFASHAPLRLSTPRAFALAGAVYGGAAIAGLAVNWNDNLRFAPWTDIVVATAIAAAAVAVTLGLRRRPLSGGATGAIAGAIGVVSIGLTLALSAWEPARKAATARAALVGPVLAAGRQVLDVDRDGFARALGGGDCDDGDPATHPGALDLPGDGLDADCDGEDATEALPPPARMFDLPGSIPADLNLLLITIDTLRADHLGCYGYPRPTSPVIDALAAEGTLFENGWAHAPSTRYSMPAIATGRWPSAITWDESIWWPRLGRSVRTTAEVLHDSGYLTAGMFSFSYFALSDRRGFERGMDVYRADRAVLHVAVNGPMESHGSSSREITDDAIAFLDANRARKLFLWLHYYDPHLSYEPHAEVPPFGSSRVDGYDGEIRFTDLHVGRLFAHLRSLGLWDRTAVVLTGDHGEGFGEHGVTEHGFDLYPAQTKVPFIVRVPGVAARRVRVPVGHVDIAPTLLNLARGQSVSAFIGRSLVADIVGPAAPDTETRTVFQEVTSERGKKRALVTATRHLLWNAVPSDTTECYDRAADPAEARDIWRGASSDATCVGLSRELRRLVAGLALPAGAGEKLARGVSAPGAPAPQPGHALAGALGDLITIDGYDLAPDPVPAGGTAEVTVHFTAKRRVEPGWRLFFHLEGPAGFRNLDHVPVEGLMPLERWRPGQRIRDRHVITFPPGTAPGSYVLYVGAFRSGQRSKVTPESASDGKDRFRVVTFTVTQ